VHRHGGSIHGTGATFAWEGGVVLLEGGHQPIWMIDEMAVVTGEAACSLLRVEAAEPRPASLILRSEGRERSP